MNTPRSLFEVCPHCKRRLDVVQRVECDGHTFPVVWHCKEHGAVPPMRSAVVNHYEPDWSAA
jgi:uncharacterized protein YbaR (Trm112 family)